MMKKKISIILFSALTLGGMTSCSDFLDRAPLDQFSDATFWSSIEDAQRFTGSFYKSLPSEMSVDEDVNTDDLTHGIKWAEGAIAQSGLYDPASSGWDYSLVRKTNMLLENLSKIPNATPVELAEVEAEARFFRGFFFAGMIQTYGDVPYTDKTLNITELMIPRTPIKEVYAKVMADIDFAIANLPLKPRQSGRLTKGAALALKCETQIYFAGFPASEIGGGMVTYAEAAATAKQIMDLNHYELWDKDNAQGNYDELFWETGNGSKEIILGYPHKNSDGFEYQYLGWGTFPKVGWGGVNPTQSLVDAFEDKDGSPIATSKIYNQLKPWENRDPRFEVNIIYHGCTLKSWGGPFNMLPNQETLLVDGNKYPTGIGACGDATATGYNQRKWVDQTVTIEYANNWQGIKEFPIWRYAEVLLWYAEAENEANGPTAAAFNAINQVRSRVGQPVLQNTDASKPTFVATKEDFRERIRNEYRVELCVEGKRFSAIRRWRQADGTPLAMKVMNEPIRGMRIKEVVGGGYEPWAGEPWKPSTRADVNRFKPFNIFYPIPQDQIDLNKDLVQNPGYN